MTRLTFPQVSQDFQSMGYELRKETKGYSCEISNKFANLQQALDWLNNQVSVLPVDSFTGDPEVEQRAKDWMNGDYDELVNETIKNQTPEDFNLSWEAETIENDDTVTFEQVQQQAVLLGWELHHNHGQFFTESKAPYIYFKTGEQEYSLNVSWLLTNISEHLQQLSNWEAQRERIAQVEQELVSVGCHPNFTENLKAIVNEGVRLITMEIKLLADVEQRRTEVRSICQSIGNMVKEWSRGFSQQTAKISRTVSRRAKRFYSMLTERVAPKTIN